MKKHKFSLCVTILWLLPTYAYAHGEERILPIFYVIAIIFLMGPILVIMLSNKKNKTYFIIGVLVTVVIDILLFNSNNPKIFSLVLLPFPALIALLYFVLDANNKPGS